MPEIQLEEVRRFMVDSLKAAGAPESEAQAHADLLMHADTVGHYSHGLNRLEFYINDIKNGACEPDRKPEILKELGATAWVDGHNALGATVGNFCMNLAIQKAKEFGVGWVAAKRSNHFGMAGYWALLAEREGLIGIAFTNTSPIMVPTRSKHSALGTNPVGMAAPATDGDKLVVDMATTSVAMGKIECQIHKEEPLPPGWALGPDSKPTTDAKAAFQAGKLLPLGGEEKSSGYKGYALAAMIEMFTSGLSELYVNDIKTGACMPNNECKILKETEATSWVDSNNVLGATSSHFSMHLAIRKAGKAGVGWVSAKGGNHNGVMGFWAQKAAKVGMIGLAFTNTSPLCAPTRSKQAALGTNPLSVVAAGSQNELFYLDMATSAVAFGKIEMQRRKGEPLPHGWAQGPDGKETLDTEEASKTRCLMPLGGTELTSGYKGFGLGAMVELFCGILAGAKYGHHIRDWTHSGAGGPADLGHCFAVVNPNCFAPGFQDRVTESMQHWRSLKPTNPCLRVLCPGDKERNNFCESEKTGTVSYLKNQIVVSAALAKKLNVAPMKLIEVTE